MSSAWSKIPSIEINGIELSFPDFEISWIGRDPSSSAYHFGSEDGRLRIMSNNDSSRHATFKLDSLGESINGVAFNGAWIAASTRCEVIFLDTSKREGGSQSRIYEGGAHGVLATTAGGFVAPLGRNGLLVMNPEPSSDLSVLISKPIGRDINFYKLDPLTGDGQRDFFAIAARKGGLAGLEILPGNVIGHSSEGRYFHAPSLDVVDVCSLSSREWPRAVAGLGADRSIHLCRDLFGDKPPKELRLKDLKGAAYTILGDQHHLFMLTSEYLYTFPNLIQEFLQNDDFGGPIRTGKIPIKAVDIYKSGEELFILLADRVIVTSSEEAATKMAETGEGAVDMASEPTRLNWAMTSDFNWVETPTAVA